jgi:hypothetical protein
MYQESVKIVKLGIEAPGPDVSWVYIAELQF